MGVPQGPFDPIVGIGQNNQPITATQADAMKTRTQAGADVAMTGVLGMVGKAPAGKSRTFTAYHGSIDPFDQFDMAKAGSGATEGRFASGADIPQAAYLTSSPQHAAIYGSNVQQFNVSAPLLEKNAASELKDWAKEMGYKSAQKMIDEYYEGNAYYALDADHYFLDAHREAQAAGLPGARVSFGNLTTKHGSRSVPMGDVFVIHDPSVLTKKP